MSSQRWFQGDGAREALFQKWSLKLAVLEGWEKRLLQWIMEDLVGKLISAKSVDT
jgi:hypothetical protein